MTQAKHTYGEWYARAPRPNAREEDGETPTYTWTVRTKYEATKGDQVGHEICEITHINEGHEEADARLIAAAPTMLEALQDCREALRRAGAEGELRVVDSAISQATGA